MHISNSSCFELHIALLVKLGVKYLFPAHCTNSFAISTCMTVLCILVHLLLAYHALCIPIRSPSVLFREKLVLVDLPATALVGVAGTVLPLIGNYYLR
uniref:Uncharacterized protein n=1 Tax=Rhizophora mucronata TaxID=61149 RepID=A0A2P2ISB2_RHIMU